MSEPLVPPFTSPLDAALWWVRSVPVVPLAPALVSDGPGSKPHPQPLVLWRKDGPLRTETEVREFWSTRPDAQLAIVLGPTADGRFLGAIDTDLKNRKDGTPEPPPGFVDWMKNPRNWEYLGPTNGYRHLTKSGGTHDLFLFEVAPPETVPRRATGIGGFVDVLLDGLLVVPPTRFDGSGEYRVVRNGPIPEFEAVGLALDAASDWLEQAWKVHRLPSAGAGAASPVVVDAGGKLPHGRHHEVIVSTAASLASRIAGLTEAQAIEVLRGALAPLLDDLGSHGPEIREAVRSALAKYGKPAPSVATGIEGPALFHELVAAMRAHYHLAEEWGYSLSALFVLQSKIVPLLPSVFYLFIVGTKGTGKTTQMDHISRLTGALRCQGISAAALRRSMRDGRTVALDQYDDIKDPEKRATMDALAEMGYTRGAPYICCDEKNQPVEMDTFGPKVLVFRRPVRDSLQDRGFTIPAAKSCDIESVYKAMWPKWADLPSRLAAWGAQVCATHQDADMEALARSPGFAQKLHAISLVLEGRDAQLLISALMVAELAGVDLEAELRRAMEIRRAEEAISSDEDLEDLSQVLLDLVGTQRKLETGEFYVVTRSTIKKALDKRRGDRKLPPSKKTDFDGWLRDLGVRDEWVRPGHRKQCWVHLPVAFLSGLMEGEAGGTPPTPPTPPGSSDVNGGVGGMGGLPPAQAPKTESQVRAVARAAFAQTEREEEERS